MEHLLWAIPASLFFFLRTVVIEHYRNKRFENFNSIYKGEKIEELGKYEQKSKGSYFPKKPKRKTEGG